MIQLVTVLYFAMSLPANAALKWWGPLTKAQCDQIERESIGTWCHAIAVQKKLK